MHTKKILREMHRNKRQLNNLLNLIEDNKQNDSDNRDNLLIELRAKERAINDKKSRLLDLFLSGGTDQGTYETKGKEPGTELEKISFEKKGRLTWLQSLDSKQEYILKNIIL